MRQHPRPLSPGLAKGIVVVLFALFVAVWYCVAEKNPAHASVGDTVPQSVQKGVNFLTPDVVNWTKQNSCIACHRQGASLYALSNAKSRGYAVDTSKTTGIGFIAQRINDEQQQDGRWTHFGSFDYAKTSYAFFGMSGYDKFVGTEYSRNLVSAANWAISRQIMSGPYGYWIEDHGLFPTTYGTIPVTARMMVGIAQAKQRVDSATAAVYQQRLDLSATWLRANRDGIYGNGDLAYTFQVAYALIGLKAAGTANDDPDIIMFRDRLLAATSQPTGHGWGYTAGHGADEFNTGIALYALGRVGIKPRTNQKVRDAINWLRDQQVNVNGTDDGYWRSNSFGSLDIPTTFAILGLSNYGDLGVELFLDGADHQVIRSNFAEPQTVTYHLTVENDGAFDATDTYSLNVQGGLPGWSARVEPSSVSLPSGQSSPVTLTITAPPNLPEALPVEMTVIATSDTDSKISANVKVTTYTDPPPPTNGDPTQTVFVEGANATITSRQSVQPLAAQVKDASTNAVIHGPKKGVTTFYVAGIAVGTDVDADGDGIFRLNWTPGEAWTANGPQDLRAVYSGIDLPASQVDLLPSFVASTINLDLATNNQPTLQVGGPYEMPEGGSIVLTAVGSNLGSGSASYAWDLDNDGTFETQGQNVSFSAVSLNGPGSYTVKAQVVSTSSKQANAQTVVNVQNVPPVLILPTNQTAFEGSLAYFDLGLLVDPGPDNPWTVNVDWGDGTLSSTFNPSSSGPLGKRLHAYADSGLYTVTLRAADKDGATDTKAFKIKVLNVPPAVTAAADQLAEAGIAKSFDLGLFTDPGPDSFWVADINWGDASAHTTFNLFAPGALTAHTHTYAANGNYMVTVRVTDKDGGVGSATFKVTTEHIAVVRHALKLTSGRIEGTIRQLLGEDGSLGGSAFITSDLKVPGVPSLKIDGSPAFNGAIEGTGSPEPSNYQVKINGNATLGGHLITRTDPVDLLPLAAPPAPTGTRDVILKQAGQSFGDASTLRNLTLTGSAGQVAVPPGTYGQFTADSHTTLLLGVANSAQPSVYNFQDLRLNGGSALRLAGPVKINVAHHVILDGTSVMGMESASRWLKLNVAGDNSGDNEDKVSVRGGSALYAIIRTPLGRITVGGNNSLLRGAVACDYLNVSGGGVLHLLNAGDATLTTNKTPLVNAGPDQTIALPSTDVNLNGLVTDDGQPLGAAMTASWSVVGGPAPVIFGNADAASTRATFSEPGTYVLRLTADDSQFIGSDDVAINVSLDNQAPIVSAGLDREIFLPASSTHLSGIVLDDGLPTNGVLSKTWSKVSGPGTVTFSSPNELVTDAAFSTAGTYVLRLTASDSQLASYAEVTIKVSAINQAPIVNAGPDQAVSLTDQVNLSGVASDDGLPAGSTLSVSWTRISGPGTVAFNNANAAVTTATFSEPGAYLLRLSASDSQFNTFSDVLINVKPPNQPPTVSAGMSQTITLPDNASLSGMISDDGLPAGNTLTISWTKSSGPGEVTFGNSSRAVTAAAFSLPGTYVLRLTASDSLLSSSAEVTITVNPAPQTNQPPTVNAGPDQTITLPNQANLNGTASDDGLPANSTVTTTWSKATGPGMVTFANPNVTVTNASFSVAGTYVLRLTATDSQLNSTDDIIVTVKEPAPVNQPPTVNAGPAQTVTLPHAANLVGAVNDDGLPEGGSISVQWAKISGPGTVAFSAPDRVTTNATFSDTGTYVLRLTASDSELSGSSEITITVNGPNQPPTVNAGPDQTAIVGAPASLHGEVSDDGLPTGVPLQATWSKMSGPGSVAFSNPHQAATAATFSAEGTYELRLTASDSELTSSDDVLVTVEAAPPAPVVSINNPADGSRITTLTNFVGTVSGGLWRLEYRLNSGSATQGQGWTMIGAGNTPVTNGLLGTLDPTLLLNGSYTFRLISTDAVGQTSLTTFSAVLDGELKVGNFSITFKDLSIPVAGLPIQVLRTYDSRDKRTGDFGTGWSLGVRNVRLEKSGELGADWEETTSGGNFPTYCLFSRKAKIVTLTFPGDEVFAFQASVSPQCQALVPIETGHVRYTQLPGPANLSGATLVPLGGDDGVFYGGSAPGTGDLIGDASLALYNPTRFQLTTANGTIYVIDEKAGVQSIADANGNTLTVNADGLIHSSGKSITFMRDGQNRITRITGPDGNNLSYAYDQNGDLASMTDPDGRITHYTYNSSHGLLEIIDPANRRGVRTEYDASGRLLSVTDEEGKTVHFEFNPNSRQEVITDRKGNITVYEFDERGDTLSITNAKGTVTRATYDGQGNPITKTDRLGNTITYTYDEHGNVLTETDAQNRVRRFTYNQRNQVTSETDANGNTTANSYDANDNLISRTDPLGNPTTFTYNSSGLMLTETDATSHTTSFEYDRFGNMTKQTDRLGNITQCTYDALGHPTSVTDSKGNTTRLSFDADGQLMTTIDALGNTTRNEYDAVGNLSATVDALGHRTEVTSNFRGMPLQMTRADGTQYAMRYDANGQLAGSSRTGGPAPAIERDSTDLPTKLTLASGMSVGYQYDADGHQTAEADPLGNTTAFQYNLLDKVTLRTDAMGHQTHYEYDGVGNLTSATDANGNKTSYTYDKDNRRVRATLPDGSFYENTYDALGEVTSQRDALGNVTAFSYDDEERLIAVTEPDGAVTRNEYDSNGNLISILDANGHKTLFEYDKLDRLLKKTFPDGTTELKEYSGSALVTSQTDRKGKTTRYEYDNMERVSAIHYPDGKTVSYTYTQTGKPDIITDSRGVTDLDYDVMERVTSVRNPDGTILAYGYDVAGNRTRITTPDGTTLYSYDKDNRLVKVTDPHGLITSYTYDAAGNLLKINHPNGLSTSRTYDQAEQLSSVKTTNANGDIVFQENYVRDADGRRTKVLNAGGSFTEYEYDAQSRLIRETSKNANGIVSRQVGYTYDGVGNRLTRTNYGTGATVSYTYNANNQLVSDGANTYTYDANGNTVTQSSTGGNLTRYTYDALNRLAQVTLPGNTTLTYSYDAAGNRVRSTDAGGSVINYLVDPTSKAPQVLAETDGSGQVVASYTVGLGLISQRRNGADSFYLQDGHGSTKALADSSGSVTDSYAYDAFGQLLASAGTTANSFLYAGEQNDAATGLYYLRARYYSPAVGRFLTTDPCEGTLDQPASQHAYAYTQNDPVNGIDPTGLFTAAEGTAIHKLIGEFYLDLYGDYFVDERGFPPNRGFKVPKLPRGRTGMGAYNRAIITGRRWGRRPDLRHYGTGDVYEIKPLTPYGIATAVPEARAYVLLLNTFERNKAEQGDWKLGYETFPPIMLFLYQPAGKSGRPILTFAYPIAPEGAVFYTDETFEDVLRNASSFCRAILGAVSYGRKGAAIVPVAESTQATQIMVEEAEAERELVLAEV
jgi:RHS repeat-associated protein